MVNDKSYSSSMTGSGFMMYEFKQLAALKLEGLTDAQVRSKVIDENIFQYNKVTSIKRAFPYLIKRVNTLDEHLKQMVVEEPNDVGKVINFYATMKHDQLFFEFMEEAISDIFEKNVNILEQKDVNVFFARKAEQSEFVNNMADSTLERLKRSYLKMLLEVGMLVDYKSRELRRLVVDEQLRDYLVNIGETEYMRLMGDEGI